MRFSCFKNNYEEGSRLYCCIYKFSRKNIGQAEDTASILQIVFTSDAHYGITRSEFRGEANADAHTVNAAMITKINTISAMTLPKDGGVNAGKKTGGIDYVIQAGDITNRMEIPHQSAASSWSQFDLDYIKGLTLINQHGRPSKLLILPGNHDATNTIGFYRPMHPDRDPTSMVNIYNLMLEPGTPKTNETYDYRKDKINYSKNLNGIHFVFLTIWPDSAERIWMEKDLNTVPGYLPVIVFVHDQPEGEAKHFTNPNAGHSINANDKFENLVTEQYKDGLKADADGGLTAIEQRGWVSFLKKHPNIKAYFHGNSNFNEFYVYSGPDNNIALNSFRVDSPMKGKYSSKDETKLSFQLITIDTRSEAMTVRECLWNTDPGHPEIPLLWGDSKTIYLY